MRALSYWYLKLFNPELSLSCHYKDNKPNREKSTLPTHLTSIHEDQSSFLFDVLRSSFSRSSSPESSSFSSISSASSNFPSEWNIFRQGRLDTRMAIKKRTTAPV